MNDYVITADQQQIINNAEKFAKFELGNDLTGHDWWHIDRVVRMVKRIVVYENANTFICIVSALLHDVADEKLNESKESGLKKVDLWLEQQGLETEDHTHILEIISTMSYNGGTNPPMRTIEGKIVQDADRLDAIGAIAIARTFLYAGTIGHPIYDPQLPPRDTLTEKHRKEKSTAINHFYEKLLKLKDQMNTPYAKTIAEERHKYMEEYIHQFFEEWHGLS